MSSDVSEAPAGMVRGGATGGNVLGGVTERLNSGRTGGRFLWRGGGACGAVGSPASMRDGDRHIIILGAGVIGVCSAHALASRGARVTLIDKGELGGACSMGNAGLLSFGHLPIPRPGAVKQALKWTLSADSPLYMKPRFDPTMLGWLWRFRTACSSSRLERSMQTLGALSRGSLGLFERYCDELGVSCDLRRGGYYELFLTRRGLEQGQANAALTAAQGLKFETVQGDELRSREPAVREDVQAAIWYPDSLSLDPHRFVTGVGDLLSGFGADVRMNCAAERLVRRNGRLVGVELSTGEVIEGSAVVLAAGAWSQKLARCVGVRLPMQPAKGYHRDVAPSEPALTTACLLAEANMVCTPMGTFMRLAGTLEFSGMNLTMRRNRLDMLSRGARRYLTALDDSSPMSEWVGMRPCSPDGLPIIGWAPGAEGLFIATAHAMLGMTLGPVTGLLVSECLLDGEPSIDLAPMRVDRF